MTDRMQLWRTHFPELVASNDPAVRSIIDSAQLVTVPFDAAVFEPGGPCDHYYLVVRGTMRVQLFTDTGREVVLYRVGAGETCILTTSCLLGDSSYPAEGVTESEVGAFMISAQEFEQALDRSSTFRRFVFARMGQRLAQVMTRIEQIAFSPIDIRLARALLQLTREQPRLHLTHQALAAELGTAREVVSRHLKRFEEHGWVKLGRGTLEIVAREPLERLSHAM